MSTAEIQAPARHRGRLYCFPFAGAGASLFHPWPEYLSEHIDVHPVQLPGRERLIAEAPFTDLNMAATTVASTILNDAAGKGQVALFGHSMGAILAFEVARRLDDEPDIDVAALIVSGSPAPDRPRQEHASGLSDEEFLARVTKLAGYRHPALDHPEMRSLILPTLRADVQMHEEYDPLGSPAIDVPIWAVRGDNDALVSAADALRWSRFTRSATKYIEVSGSHMYLTESTGFAALAQLINRLLGRAPETKAAP